MATCQNHRFFACFCVYLCAGYVRWISSAGKRRRGHLKSLAPMRGPLEATASRAPEVVCLPMRGVCAVAAMAAGPPSSSGWLALTGYGWLAISFARGVCAVYIYI